MNGIYVKQKRDQFGEDIYVDASQLPKARARLIRGHLMIGEVGGDCVFIKIADTDREATAFLKDIVEQEVGELVAAS